MSGIEIGLSKPSQGGAPPTQFATRGAGQLLAMLILVPGLLVCMTARMIYPLLDDGPAFGLMVVLFLLPFLIQLTLVLRKQSNARLLRLAYGLSGCVLMIFALCLLLNGGMDKSASTLMTTTVIRKSVDTGRHGTQQYHLIVSSWRPGRSSEDLNVGSRVFQRAAVGRNVSIEVHQGFFNLPWSGKIRPE